MRVLVVCESMYGNTHVVASNITKLNTLVDGESSRARQWGAALAAAAGLAVPAS